VIIYMPCDVWVRLHKTPRATHRATANTITALPLEPPPRRAWWCVF